MTVSPRHAAGARLCQHRGIVWFLRRSARAKGLPEGWRDLLRRHVRAWRFLDDEEREAVAERMDSLLRRPIWEPARGFELDDRVRVVISAQASLLAMGLDADVYDAVTAVIVHPTTLRMVRTEAGPIPGTETCGSVSLLGEAVFEGPVVIAWDSASRSARHPERGHDVVVHEFAHAIDMLDGTVDGTPPLPHGPFADEWIELNTDAFHRLSDGDDPVLDPYGATDAGEFFAVVSETFMTVPTELQGEHPGLYDLYRRYYCQDPARRASLEPRSD